MIKNIILALLSLFFLSGTFAFNTITLNKYKQIKEYLYKNSDKLKYNDKLNFYIDYLSEQTCNYFSSADGIYYFKPSCFLNGLNNNLSFKESVDIVWPLIKGFGKIYDLNSTKFYYSTAKPEFYVNYNLDDYVGNTKLDYLLLGILEVSDYYIKVPKIFLAYENMKKYSFYVSDKNLQKRNESRLSNFNIAMNKLDNYILNPGKEIYFNKLIAYLPGYKKKNPKSKYAFYGGVCGVSTMLFRNSLINPYLFVKERHNHSQWYVNFYSKYIYGDDASVYEFIKKFIVKNISNYPIYFKKKQIGKELYFVSIVPKKIKDFTIIEKKQTGRLSAFLKTSIYDENGNIKYIQSWVSKYIKRNYEK